MDLILFFRVMGFFDYVLIMDERYYLKILCFFFVLMLNVDNIVGWNFWLIFSIMCLLDIWLRIVICLVVCKGWCCGNKNDVVVNLICFVCEVMVFNSIKGLGMVFLFVKWFFGN